MNRSTYIGAGIGALSGAIGGFMSPSDTTQERIVSTLGGAAIGGFIGGGTTSALNFKPKNTLVESATSKLSKKSYISKGPGIGLNTKVGKVVKKGKSIPGKSISSLSSSVAGTTPGFFTGDLNHPDPATRHINYVNAINRANRTGNTAFINKMKTDTYASGNKLLSGKLNGLWN